MGKIDAEAPLAKSRCLIALGSNVALDGKSPSEVLEQALAALDRRGFVIRATSRFYLTPAFPTGAGPDYVNAAAVVETALAPQDILAQLHAVESLMGRTRDARWGARTLDLDLLAVGPVVLPDAQTHRYWCEMPLEMQKTATPQELVLPHPRLAERAFVLVPLLDVAPDWRHPVSGLSVREMHDALPPTLRDEIKAL